MTEQARVDLDALRARWNRWKHGMDPDLPDQPMTHDEFLALAEEVEHLRSALRRVRRESQWLRNRRNRAVELLTGAPGDLSDEAVDAGENESFSEVSDD